MSKNFLKPFALTVGTILMSTQANAEIDTQVVDAVAHITSASAATNLADLSLTAPDQVFAADAHGSHVSHASHASHSSHSSHSSSAY